MPEISTTAPLGPHTVHRVGFGAMQLPGPGVFGPPKDRNQALAVLRRAVEAGVDHIDTAQYYGPDVANQLIHEALHPYPENLVLVSKVGARRDDRGGWLPAYRPDELKAGVEDNLRTLGVDHLGAVNLRLMDGNVSDQQLADQLGALIELRHNGAIEGIGVSNVNVSQLEAALAITDIVCVQNQFSVLDRSGIDVLRACEQRGIAYVPFFPLGSAFDPSRSVNNDPTVTATAARLGLTPAQVALAWLLALAPNVLLIPGTSSLGHLEENLAVSGVRLDPDAQAALDALG
jgi:pyridoxine 4-dehydrogenase